MNKYVGTAVLWLDESVSFGLVEPTSQTPELVLEKPIPVPSRCGQRAVLRRVRANWRLTRRRERVLRIGRCARFIRCGRLSSFADTQGKTPRRTWTDRGVLGHGLSGG